MAEILEKMTNSQRTFIGHVIRLNPQQNFGFIESENFEEFYFYIDTKKNKSNDEHELQKKQHKFCLGDEVQFKLRKSLINQSELEAYDLKFIKNRRIELLLEEAKNNKILKGYLKLIGDDNFYVKHIPSYIFIKLKISKSETDIQDNYYNKTNSLVEFELTQFEKTDKLSAVLINRKFKEIDKPILNIIESKEVITATITGRNLKGYYVTILDNTIKSFIYLKKDTMDLTDFKKGEKIKVIIKETTNSYKLEVVS